MATSWTSLYLILIVKYQCSIYILHVLNFKCSYVCRYMSIERTILMMLCGQHVELNAYTLLFILQFWLWWSPDSTCWSMIDLFTYMFWFGDSVMQLCASVSSKSKFQSILQFLHCARLCCNFKRYHQTWLYLVNSYKI